MKKRFKGNDRFLMFLCRDIRRRWMQYGENRLYNLKTRKTKCAACPKRATQWDHIFAVGQRPYSLIDLPDYIDRMINGRCQPMCMTCNSQKADK